MSSNTAPFSSWRELMSSLETTEDHVLIENRSLIDFLFQDECDRLTIGIVIPEKERQEGLFRLDMVERPKIVDRGIDLPPLSRVRQTQSIL